MTRRDCVSDLILASQGRRCRYELQLCLDRPRLSKNGRCDALKAGVVAKGMVLLGAEAEAGSVFLTQSITVYSWCIVRNKPYTLQKCAFLSEVCPRDVIEPTFLVPKKRISDLPPD